MGIFFVCIFILITFFSLLHLYQVYKNNIFKKDRGITVGENKIQNKDIAMLVPCYNEDVVITSAVENFISLKYPKLKVIFINDGSTDSTMSLLKELLTLSEEKFEGKDFLLKCEKIKGFYSSNKYKNIYVIDKENGGKADSLNAAVNLVNSEYVVTLDADSILKDDALEQINKTLQDEEIIATGGNIITSQGVENFSGEEIRYKAPKKIVESIQFIDYLKGFFITKNSYSNLNALAVISGAFGVFKKDVMIKVGGFTKSVGEDIDITIKFHKYAIENNKKIIFNDKAICFTEVPSNWSDFFKQRVRWQKGFIDAIKNHRKFLVRNFFSNRLSFFMLFENLILAYVSIICMLIGFYFLGFDIIYHIKIGILMYIVLLIGVFIYVVYDLTIFIMAKKSVLKISKFSIPIIIGLLIYEVFIYRQIMMVIYLWGTVEYFFKPNSWNKVQRTGANDKLLVEEEKKTL